MYENLEVEMLKKKIGKSDIARTIKKTDRCVRDKMSGKGDFTWGEVNIIRDTHFPECSIEYLFAVTS